MNDNLQIYVRDKKACEIMGGISRTHFWSLISSGKIKAYKPSAKVTLVKVSDLINYIENSNINDN